jgi:hypothetical protein
MKHRLVVLAIAMLALFVSAGQAVASDEGDPAQAAGQAAASGQAAGALSGASQSHPKNQNISVRVLSPGNAGSVTQTNAVSSDATAANANLTGQSADQTQSGTCGCEGGTQAVGQSASNDQAATALSLATQADASNSNIPVRVLSDGNDGSVEQTNSVESDATAANVNATGQTADQSGAGGSGTQAIGQSADSEQDAAAASKAEQTGAKNTNISVRVLSPGDDGDVSQSNTVESDATAANLNLTGQHADQDQSGAGGTQAIGQSAKSDQKAAALSVAKQHGASNKNVPVRVLSPGDGGNVEQTNSVDSDATAANLNATKQDADQDQSGRGCGCSSDGTQAIGQSAKNDQAAIALSAALQSGASNSSTPVRIDSKGDDGSVSQSNSVESDAKALNVNLTKQDADQSQSGGSSSTCCESGGTQAIGQSADSSQGALAASLAAQSAGHDRCGCSSGGNSNTPVRVDSKGDGGHVDQSNKVESDATAANLNALKQDADQDQSGSGGIQAIGQSAKNEQAAAAFSAALQAGASNSNTPVRVDSYGDDGDVDQSNKVDSDATALNANLTKQDADQEQSGSTECGCHDGIGIQAIGQEAKNEQSAAALSAALQFGASNSNAPVRVDSSGDGGSVDQSNKVESDATAANLNALKQDADQTQTGGGGIAIQAIGQSAKNDQAALALSAALQFGASNSSTPVRVDSKGDDGDVDQSNKVDSDATALNLNLLKQDADQEQSGSKECGCHGGIGIQAIGQESKSEQAALAASLAAQAGGHGKCGCSSDGNSYTPVRVDSPGDDGSVDQSNEVDSDATAANLNLLGQHARQGQGGAGGIQAIGQSAKNRQAAFALSVALQLAGFHERKPLLAP